jgi:hypothetical protein
VRAIRLSELKALHVRVLRPVGLDDIDRNRLADWVLRRIGSDYDLAHAWALARKLLQLPLSTRLRSSQNEMANGTTRFICCSLVAHAFLLVGYPIRPVRARVNSAGTVDPRNITPGDFESAPLFEVVGPIDNVA